MATEIDQNDVNKSPTIHNVRNYLFTGTWSRLAFRGSTHATYFTFALPAATALWFILWG